MFVWILFFSRAVAHDEMGVFLQATGRATPGVHIGDSAMSSRTIGIKRNIRRTRTGGELADLRPSSSPSSTARKQKEKRKPLYGNVVRAKGRLHRILHYIPPEPVIVHVQEAAVLIFFFCR